jgi:drug/metabolite transporter (DMT)-like permease
VGRRHLLTLLVLAALWGASFLFIKVGVRELAPTTLICLRLAIGALTILPLALARLGGSRVAAELRRHWWPLLVAGVMNSALPITVLAWAEKRLDSGLSAVIQAASPLFTALLALAFVRTERVTGWRLAGLLVGFGGVALLVGAQPAGDLSAAAAVVGTASCYAIAALYSARRLATAPPLVTAVGALAWGAVVLAPFAALQAPSSAPSAKVVGALLALSLGGTGVAYVLYYALLAGPGASYAILVTYLTPAMALLYGATFLGEAVTGVALGGLALVLLGVALGTGALRPLRRRAPVASAP